MKAIVALATVALIAAVGLPWFLSKPALMAVKNEPSTLEPSKSDPSKPEPSQRGPLKASAEIPTFHRVADGSGQSVASDNDPERDRLRNATLAAANDLRSDPCNAALKARYIEAASQYARARLRIVPCVGTHTCGPADGPRFDQAKKAFGTDLDHRVQEAMNRVHMNEAFVTGDFPKDAVVMVAALAGDGEISPYASPEFKEFSSKLRSPADCGAASPR